MDRVATAAPEVRSDLFAETASRMGVDARIIEKDFWVCWTLKQLFALPTLRRHFTFKGGTTLSKVFGVIQRFSEDVDIRLAVSANRSLLTSGAAAATRSMPTLPRSPVRPRGSR